MRTPFSTLGAGLALALAAAAPGQGHQVVISEINLSAQGSNDDQWIEIHNRGTTKVDLSTWSIYQATKTPFMPNNYWWGFPVGTELAGGGYLRVHWLQPIPTGPPTPGQLYTGDTVFHFLFGLYAEPLNKNLGALALFRSQDNLRMNDPNVIADWVSWGGNGFPREDLAIQNQRWTSGAFVEGAVAKDAIALNIAGVSEPTPVSAYFHDASNTPLGPNAKGAGNGLPYGSATILGGSLPTTPSLGSRSFSAPGNRDFELFVDGTTGNEWVVLLIGYGQVPSGVPVAGMQAFVDPGTISHTVSIVPSTSGETVMLDFAGVTTFLAGNEFFSQAVLIDLVQSQVIGSTNALRFVVGDV